jgi:hypothetical protein
MGETRSLVELESRSRQADTRNPTRNRRSEYRRSANEVEATLVAAVTRYTR